MSQIKTNIQSVRSRMPESVELVAVSKTRPVSDILEAYSEGVRSFGENRVQELLSKKDKLPGDIRWHLIGHLQSNKVKYIVPFVDMVQSVDSLKLLKTIDEEAAKVTRIINCLLQVHIAEEDTKFGFDIIELKRLIVSEKIFSFKNIRICGLMGMATFTSDKSQIRKEFKSLATYFESLKSEYFEDSPYFKDISMGMSDDFEIAIEEGSTMVRIGSLIFGSRTYNN